MLIERRLDTILFFKKEAVRALWADSSIEGIKTQIGDNK